MTEPIIRVTNLSTKYGDRFVLRGVNMSVNSGEIMIILGGSGCGKSTLLKHIIRLLHPYSGQIHLFGQDITRMEEHEFEPIQRQMGVLFQNGALINSLTISENVALPLQMHTRLPDDLIWEIVRVKLHLVELDHAYHLFPPELSGGMRKRAALARAIALDPQILFCDEPSAGLDPVTCLEIDQLFLKLNRQLGMTLVVVTHELESIKRIAQKITYLDQGKALFSGAFEDALKSGIPQIDQFFLKSAP
ncbi:MAG: ATP-binding cassette domain-containing protein [Gemmatimonadetes bacterium]|nr:MAG: ATP-binding cassette domain-containing protein [Gemmatimonadota bacterium]